MQSKHNQTLPDEILQNKTSAQGKTSWLDKAARSILLSALKKIKVGHLTIVDGDSVYIFGEDAKYSEVVAHINVLDSSAYRRVLLGGTIGSGEAYMESAWWSPDLVQVIRIFVLNMDLMEQLDSRWSAVKQLYFRVLHRIRDNSKVRSRKNISAHYDLGNDFYRLFLDEDMMYSSAIYPSQGADLSEASKFKLDVICKKLKLVPSDHLLEVGSGWGGLAIYAAKHFGCSVTSVTISKEQYQYALERVEQEGLTGTVKIVLQDYREISGQYDKLVSVEMIEAVGYRYYDTFFKKCSSLLKGNGLMLIQTITIPESRYDKEKNNADFIQTYIFPGGCLPSILALSESVGKNTDMQLVDLQEIGLHYAKTLSMWKHNFFERIDDVRQLGYDDVFIRMWDFYLSYCEGGFLERAIGASQLLYAKPKHKDLD